MYAIPSSISGCDSGADAANSLNSADSKDGCCCSILLRALLACTCVTQAYSVDEPQCIASVCASRNVKLLSKAYVHGCRKHVLIVQQWL
jgi:hypothetical protein